MSAAYIVAAVRTAAGRKSRRLSHWHTGDIAGQVIDAIVVRTHAHPALIDDLIIGFVSQVGQQAGHLPRQSLIA
jgi:acetyl-CoA C-acetyltransferase